MSALIEFGDCRETMRRWASLGIRAQTCVTSPPYWGLRDYGHAGQLGLEPTFAEFLTNMVEVFRCVRDVLADDGTLWLNMGDSYAGSGRGGYPGNQGNLNGPATGQDISRRAREIVSDSQRLRAKAATGDRAGREFKPKDLIGQPWRLAFALQDDGWFLRQDIVWHKPNPMPESVSDRCTKAHEYIFLLSKRPRYFMDPEGLKEPVSGTAHARRARGPGAVNPSKPQAAYEAGDERHRTAAGLLAYSQRMAAKGNGAAAEGKGERMGREAGWRNKNNMSMDAALSEMVDRRNKRSVWTVASKPYKGAHFATFPPTLIEPCVLAGSRPGDAVLDPFMGSGTTAMVAVQHGRLALGCEVNPEYGPLQQERLASLRARTAAGA